MMILYNKSAEESYGNPASSSAIISFVLSVLILVVVAVIFTLLLLRCEDFHESEEESFHCEGSLAQDCKPEPELVGLFVEYSTEESIRYLASNIGVPKDLAVNLAEYLSSFVQNQTEQGIGLFAISPDYLEWIRNKDTSVEWDPMDPYQNTIMGLYLLKMIKSDTETWKEAVLIYVYGHSVLIDMDYSPDLDYIWTDIKEGY